MSMLKHPALATPALAPPTPSIPIPPATLQASPQSAEARLDRLLQTIASVLRAYEVLPIRSPVYYASLQQFLQRAQSLHPDLPARPMLPPDQAGGRFSFDYHDFGAERGRNLARSAALRRPPPPAHEVEALEREWWASEVVAAWYGPQPGLLSGKTRGPWTGVGRRASSEKEKRAESLVRRDDD